MQAVGQEHLSPDNVAPLALDPPLERARAVTSEFRSYNKIAVFVFDAVQGEALIGSAWGNFLLEHYTPHFILPQGVREQLGPQADARLASSPVYEFALSEIREIWGNRGAVRQTLAATAGGPNVVTAGTKQAKAKLPSNPKKKLKRRGLRKIVRRLLERVARSSARLHPSRPKPKRAPEEQGQPAEARAFAKWRKLLAVGARGMPPLAPLLDLLVDIDPLFGVTLMRTGDTDFALANEFALAAGKISLPVLLLKERTDFGADPLVVKVKKTIVDIDAIVSDRAVAELERRCAEMLVPEGHKGRASRVHKQRWLMSHAYSADRIMAAYCGLATMPMIPDYWMHGWMPEYHNAHPEIIALHKLLKSSESIDERLSRIDAEKATRPQFVSREDQAKFLGENGYTQSVAIGIPFVYLPPVAVARVPGSLLVMPPHGRLRHGPGDRVAEAYAEYIAGKRDRFSSISVIVTLGDYVNREWVDAFECRDIEVLIGTQQGEQQTLLRQKALLSSAEYVTTNGFGSHIAYAAACGCKVSVAGPFAEWESEQLARVFAVKTFPRLLPTVIHLHSEAAIREAFPFLFVEPEEAVTRREWGEHQIGVDCKKRPEEIMDLFGWSAEPHAPGQAQSVTPPAGGASG